MAIDVVAFHIVQMHVRSDQRGLGHGADRNTILSDCVTRIKDKSGELVSNVNIFGGDKLFPINDQKVTNLHSIATNQYIVGFVQPN